MQLETQLWVGIDLGSRTHQVCALNERKEVVLERTIEHSGASIISVIAELTKLASGSADHVHVALETPQSAVVEMLLERGCDVYTINPKQLDRFRDRHTVAGAKDDRRDAFVLAHSLCTDGALFRHVILGAAELVELKALVRMRDELQVEANVLSNRIEAELLRCFPEIRVLGPVQTEPWFLALLQQSPTPVQARQMRLSQVRAVLKNHKIRKSLPGAGTIVSATLLAVAGQALATRDYAQLRALSGVAPVTKRSGKSTLVSMRRACSSQLRGGVYHWARCSAQRDPRSKEQYARLRARGHSHGRALRGVADRLLDLLVTLLRRGELFEPSKRKAALSA